MNLRWVWGRVVIFDLDFFRIIQRRDDSADEEQDNYSVGAQLQVAERDEADDTIGGDYYGFGFGKRP